MNKCYKEDSARIEMITREKIRLLREKECRENTHTEYKAFLQKTKHKIERDAKRLCEIEEEIHNFVNPSEQFTAVTAPIKKVITTPMHENKYKQLFERKYVERKYVEPYIFKKPGDSLLFQVVFFMVGTWILRYLCERT